PVLYPTGTTSPELCSLSLHDALPISNMVLFPGVSLPMVYRFRPLGTEVERCLFEIFFLRPLGEGQERPDAPEVCHVAEEESYAVDRKSTRLNSSHVKISYAVFCLKKK